MIQTTDELLKERANLENRLADVRRELRRRNIQYLLDKLGVKAGQYILADGEKWRLGTMFELELNNRGEYIWLYGYKVRKDGKDSKRLTCIYSPYIEPITE